MLCFTAASVNKIVGLIKGLLHLVLLKPLNFAYVQLLNKPYENEVTLTGQNSPLKYCQNLEILYTVKKKLDPLTLKILGL